MKTPFQFCDMIPLMDTLLIAVIVFFAIFTQSLAGFGLALVSMPLLARMLDPVGAASLVSLIAITAEALLILRLRRTLQPRPLARLIIGSLLGIPMGVYLLANIDSRVILTALGVVMIGYSLYGLLNFTLPEIRHPRWGYGFGFIAGILSGAYNTAGPPLVIYGTARRWSRDEFKANLQLLFIINSVTVIISHALAGHYTANILAHYLVALPMIALGVGAGVFADKWINPQMFRKIVLVLLIVLGVRLILP